LLPWKIKRDTKSNYFTGGWWLLLQHGFLSGNARIKPQQEARFNLTATFSNEDIYTRYQSYLRKMELPLKK
jgi:hypothetical protein